MKPKLLCNHAPPLSDLWRSERVRLDGVEFTPFHSPRQICVLKKSYPGCLYLFHASNVGRIPGSLFKLSQYLRFCPDSLWISLHLSPLPSWLVFLALRFNLFLPVPDQQRLISRFIKRIRRLQRRVQKPIILENMAVLPELHSHFESEPKIIHQILAATGCQLLLDIAHARIAADYRGISVRAYLAELPLARVCQVHISGPRKSNQGRLFDAHQSLQEEDYALLDWVLEQTQPEVVTLEYFRGDAEDLVDMLSRLDQILDAWAVQESSAER